MLFQNTPETINLEEGTLLYQPGAWQGQEADRLFDALRALIPWQQDYLRIAAQQIPVPRLQAWFGEAGASYTYSGLTLQPHPWPDLLVPVRERVSTIASHPFDSALVNLYRDGKDSVGWHADDEPELGPQPVIASVSLGASRRFQLRHRHKRQLRYEITLQHGDLLVMAGPLQCHWEHQVPKEKAATGERINLTFRKIYQKAGQDWRKTPPNR